MVLFENKVNKIIYRTIIDGVTEFSTPLRFGNCYVPHGLNITQQFYIIKEQNMAYSI